MLPHYIDPGTGSMLFAILIGIAGALNFLVRSLMVKARFILSGGKDVKANEDTIPIAIFSDDKRYWNIFEPIVRELDARETDVVFLTASDDDPAFKASYEHLKCEYIGEGNKGFAKLNLLKATIVLSTTPGLDVYQWKRSREVRYYVHILHAAGDVILYRMFGLDYYDGVLLAGKFQENDLRKLERMRGLPAKDLAITGIPYMDEMVTRLKNAGPVPMHPKTVLLAPSWGPSAIFSVYGERIIEALLATDCNIIIRPHPQSFKSETEMINGLIKAFPENERLQWNRDVDNFECLRQADILISDFSGVIFDFALVYNKPVIYADTSFDTSPYDAWWLEGEPWNLAVLPRIGMQLKSDELETLGKTINICLSDPRFEQGRNELRAEAWQECGTGAKATTDWLLEKLSELQAEEANG